MFPKKEIAILISLIFLSSSAIAQTTTSTSGKFTLVKKGEQAPFDGTLFDPVATAKIISERKTAESYCRLRMQYEKDLANAVCKRNTDIISSELEIERKKHKLIVGAQKEEIETLRDLAKGSDNTLWAIIGFALGAGTSIAIFYAATEIAK